MSIDHAGSRTDSGRLTLPFSRTFVAALVLEAVLLVGVGSLLARAETPPRPRPPEVLELAFDEPKVEETKKPVVRKEVPKPMPKPVPKPVPRKVVQAPVRVPQPMPAPSKALPVANDSPLSEKVVVQAPPPPPPPRDDSAAKEASFAAALKAAIQAAVVYPPAARMSGFQGQTQVEFVFRDGVCSQVRVIRSSGSGLIDRAALAAVTEAVPPPVPPSLKGRTMTYEVTVLFALDASEE